MIYDKDVFTSSKLKEYYHAMRELSLLLHIGIGIATLLAYADHGRLRALSSKSTLLVTSTVASGVGLVFAGAGIGRACLSAGVFLAAIMALRQYSAKHQIIRVIDKD